MKTLKVLTLALIIAASFSSMAEDKLAWRFFPTKAPAQKELLKLIKDGNYRQALLFWNTSLSGESFVETANAKALFDFLLWKAGAPVLASERLFSLRSPKYIHPTVVSLWKVELSTGAEAVHKAKVNISSRWKKVLGTQLSRKLQRPPVYALSGAKTLKVLQKELKKKSLTADERNWLTFQLGLAASIQNKHQLAYNQFVRLLESEQATVDKADLYMALARLAYQQGEYDAAIDWYKQVPKKSPLWLESKEERAWAHVRLDEPNKAVAQLETATSPVFTPLSGPESDFLDSFVSLMICDYSKIFKITGKFKAKHAVRIKGLETLAKTRNSALHNQFVATVDSKPIRLSSFSKLVRSLPRDFILDEFLHRHMEHRRAMAVEGKRIARLNKGAVSLASYTADAPEDSLEAIYGQSQVRAQASGKEAFDRLEALAKSELEEFRLMIRKLHIVEAEVIQRLHLDENLKGKRAKRENPVPRSSDILTFPVTKEVWLDELDSYHAEVKDCPKIERASL
ncbi:MAG: tetratricopeptide repeat protein [Bdellovibrionales bacterium]|nr:tetratricopeptide repeat protein [Bdellovibrionales bacterium]